MLPTSPSAVPSAIFFRTPACTPLHCLQSLSMLSIVTQPHRSVLSASANDTLPGKSPRPHTRPPSPSSPHFILPTSQSLFLPRLLQTPLFSLPNSHYLSVPPLHPIHHPVPILFATFPGFGSPGNRTPGTRLMPAASRRALIFTFTFHFHQLSHSTSPYLSHRLSAAALSRNHRHRRPRQTSCLAQPVLQLSISSSTQILASSENPVPGSHSTRRGPISILLCFALNPGRNRLF